MSCFLELEFLNLDYYSIMLDRMFRSFSYGLFRACFTRHQSVIQGRPYRA
jgi:hypothetical protein